LNNLFNTDTGTFILRVSFATILLVHSLYLKLIVFTLAGTALLVGFNVRFFSAVVIPVLLGATWVHSKNGWLFTNTAGGWEYPLMLTLIAVALLGLGDGRYAISTYFPSKRPKTRQNHNKETAF